MDSRTVRRPQQTIPCRTGRAWRRLCDGNPDAYTRKVMYHLQISWWRRGRSAEITTDRVPEPSPRGRADDLHVTKVALHSALAKLPPKQRAVIVLRFFEDRTEAATAEILGGTIGTVKSQAAKALLKLRTIASQFEEVAR